MEEDLAGRVSTWVNAIMHHDQRDLSFDEIYHTAYLVSSTDACADFVRCITDSFRQTISLFQEEIFREPPAAFAGALQELCPSVMSSIDVLTAAFTPLTFVLPDLRLSDDLLAIFKDVVFSSPDHLGIDAFLSTYAHRLPGSLDIESEMISLLLNFLAGTRRWPIFVQHLIEATDALCLQISSAAILRGATVACYFGVVQEVLEHEAQLWQLLPPDVAQLLRETATTGLIVRLHETFIFSEKARQFWADNFFENLYNFSIFRELFASILADEQTQIEIVGFITGHFIAKPVNDCVPDMIDTFERIDIMATALPHVTRSLDGLKHFLIANPALKIERSVSAFVGECVRRRDIFPVRRCAELVRFMPDPPKFTRIYATRMLSRLFQTCARDWKLEQAAARYLMISLPDFGLDESARVNMQQSQSRASPLRVVLLPAVRCPGVVSGFQMLVLPEPFAQMQSAFDSFYRRLTGTQRLRLVWVFEDNITDLRIVFDECRLRLRVPLLLAVVLTIVYQYQNTTTESIASKTRLTPAQVDAIVAPAASREFPILLVGNAGRVAFNMRFTTAWPRKVEIVIPELSLRVPMDHNVTKQSERSVSLRSIYEAQILRVMKTAGVADAGKLLLAVRTEVERKFGAFKKEEYERTLIVLEGSGFISKDPKNPARWLYMPEM
jgi:hypothetical protein